MALYSSVYVNNVDRCGCGVHWVTWVCEMVAITKCYWSGKKVSPKVGIHNHCWEALKGFALKL
jgi:hypothetical protein